MNAIYLMLLIWIFYGSIIYGWWFIETLWAKAYCSFLYQLVDQLVGIELVDQQLVAQLLNQLYSNLESFIQISSFANSPKIKTKCVY